MGKFKTRINLKRPRSGHTDNIRNTRPIAYFRQGFFQCLLIGCNKSKPHVVLMVSPVIVGDAGIGVYNCDELFQFFFGILFAPYEKVSPYCQYRESCC